MEWPEGPFPCSGKHGFVRKRKKSRGGGPAETPSAAGPSPGLSQELSPPSWSMTGKKNISGCLLWVWFGWQWVLWSHRTTRPGCVSSMQDVKPRVGSTGWD